MWIHNCTCECSCVSIECSCIWESMFVFMPRVVIYVSTHVVILGEGVWLCTCVNTSVCV